MSIIKLVIWWNKCLGVLPVSDMCWVLFHLIDDIGIDDIFRTCCTSSGKKVKIWEFKTVLYIFLLDTGWWIFEVLLYYYHQTYLYYFLSLFKVILFHVNFCWDKHLSSKLILFMLFIGHFPKLSCVTWRVFVICCSLPEVYCLHNLYSTEPFQIENEGKTSLNTVDVFVCFCKKISFRWIKIFSNNYC